MGTNIYCEHGCGYLLRGATLAEMGCDMLRHHSEKHGERVFPMFIECCEYIERNIKEQLAESARVEAITQRNRPRRKAGLKS